MGRLSNTDGQIYIDKAVMVDKREGMTDMERQKDGKQVFDQRPEGFFTGRVGPVNDGTCVVWLLTSCTDISLSTLVLHFIPEVH